MAKKNESAFIEALTENQRQALLAKQRARGRGGAVPSMFPPAEDRLKELSRGGDPVDAWVNEQIKQAKKLRARCKVFDLHDVDDVDELEAVETRALHGDVHILDRKWAISAQGDVALALRWNEYNPEAHADRDRELARSAGRIEDAAKTTPGITRAPHFNASRDNFAGMPSLVYPDGVVPDADGAQTRMDGDDAAKTLLDAAGVASAPKASDEIVADEVEEASAFDIFVPSDEDLARIDAAFEAAEGGEDAD